MTSRDFVFWLQGYLEIAAEGKFADEVALTPGQLRCVQRHLALVFKHEIDPSMKEPGPKTEHEKKLDGAHFPGSGGKDPLIRC